MPGRALNSEDRKGTTAVFPLPLFHTMELADRSRHDRIIKYDGRSGE